MTKRFFCISVSLILLLAGCDSISKTSESNNLTAATESSIQTNDLSESNTNINTESQNSSFNAADIVSTINTLLKSNIQGKVQNVYYAHDNNLLVWADNLYLYDILSGKMSAKTEINDSYLNSICTTKSEYILTELSGFPETSGSYESSDIKAHVIFYDSNLVKLSDFEVNTLLDENDYIFSPDELAISSSGTYLAYSSSNGLYLYNFETKQQNMLIDFTSDDNSSRLGLCGIEQLGFINNNTTIAFRAQSLDVPPIDGKQSFDTIGMINIDGSDLMNQKYDNYPTKELTIYPSKLLIAEDFMTATGQMMIMDTESKESIIYSLTDKNEGVNIYGSDSGEYFASSVRDEGGWTIRIYDTESCKLQAEQFVSNDGQELYGVRDPVLRVLDEAKVCIVLLGSSQDSVDTKIVAFSF